MRAVRILENRLESPPRACEVAAQVGVSTRQLERLLDRHLGTSPKRHAMELRFHKARNLIVQTEQSIAEITMASGFNTTSHFARVFRARFGVSPVAYRIGWAEPCPARQPRQARRGGPVQASRGRGLARAEDAP